MALIVFPDFIVFVVLCVPLRSLEALLFEYNVVGTWSSFVISRVIVHSTK